MWAWEEAAGLEAVDTLPLWVRCFSVGVALASWVFCLFVVKADVFRILEFYLFIYGRAGSSPLSPVVASHGCSLVAVHRRLLQWLLLLWNMGSRARWFSSCGAWAPLPCRMWNPPGAGIIPMDSALASGFLTTGPSGKSAIGILDGLLLYCVVH